ncbi:hypothetical protein [Guptibacillus algicola]|uniref:hypothetical protein n=1 Tax=Guptibacillus algicola TaxID=225844 RepID=UPI001CD3D1E3|nr:hypothetical protein [Alkalihalobacillus algicola]MCA0987547.1 hypothetical protein [Alkalihalobacillus algicola]
METTQTPAYNNINEAAKEVLELISKFIDVNTFFVAKNDKQNVDILESFNREDILLESGYQTLYRDSY